MKYTNGFQLVSNELGKAKIPFLLVGGFAVLHYDASRRTQDIDFIIAEEDYPRVRTILEAGGYKEFRRESIFARFRSDKLFFMDVDILFSDRKTVTEMLKEAQQGTIHGEKFKVPSLNHLLAMKLHALKHSTGERDYKDLLDVMDLVTRNRIDVKSESFRNFCLKYGTPEVYRKIKELSPR